MREYWHVFFLADCEYFAEISAKKFRCKAQRELVAKSCGRLCRGIIICVASRAAQKAHSFQMRVLVLPRKGSAARAWAGFL